MSNASIGARKMRHAVYAVNGITRMGVLQHGHFEKHGEHGDDDVVGLEFEFSPLP